MARTLAKCEICREWIGPERLEARPNTKLCALHGREIEKYGGEFILVGEQERTSKKESFKPTYGSVATKEVPNTKAIEKLRRDYEDEQYSG